MSNILLIGAGYIGQNLIPKLLAKKHNLTVVDRNSKPLFFASNLTWHSIDASGQLNFAELFSGQDILLNLMPTNFHEKNIGIDLGVDVHLVEEMAKAASQNGIKKIIYASSAAVYGNQSVHKISEASSPSPINNYGFSKLILEGAHNFFCNKFKVNLIIARISNPYGQSSKVKKSKSFFDFLKSSIVGNEPLFLVNGGDIYRDFIYLDDLTDALINLIESSGFTSTINLGVGHASSLLEIVNYANKIFDIKIKIISLEKPPEVIAYSCFDVSLYQKFFGEIEKNNFFEGLDKYFKTF